MNREKAQSNKIDAKGVITTPPRKSRESADTTL
jgi:hypothetical protein